MLRHSSVLLICALAACAPSILNAECFNDPTDVIFLVDASTNNHTEFQKMLDFVVSLVDKMDIGVYDYKVGMLIFSRSYRSVFYLSKYDNKNDTIAAIKSTRHNILNRVVTDTGDALNYARRSMASTSYGRRHGAKLVVVTLVSSPSSSPSATVANAKALKDSTGATMLSIGVGSRVPDSDLAALASDPTLINRVAGFDDLPSAEMNVMLEICPNNWHTVSPQTGGALSINDCPATLQRDHYLQVFRGVCYQFNVFNLRSYAEATRDCEQKGGTLVLVKDRQTNFFLQNELYNTYHISASVWIGLVEKSESGDASRGQYVWADGQPAKYTNFGQVIGHDTEKNCIAIVPQLTSSDAGRWREYHCDPKDADVEESSRLRHVCQFTVNTAAPDVPTTLEPTDPSTVSTASPASGNTTVVETDAPTTAGVTSDVTNATVVTAAPTQASSAAAASQATTVCPPFQCTLDCGVDGYQKDANKCFICVCNV